MREKLLPMLLALLLPFPAFTAGSNDTAGDEQLLKAAGVGGEGTALLDFFRRSTLTGADQERIQALIRQLGDEDYAQREKASAELLALGSTALPKLREAIKDRDPEVAYRAKACLRQLDDKRGPQGEVFLAAVRQVARKKPAGAVEVLLAYLPTCDDETVAEEVRSALAACAVHDGKLEPALTAALTGKDAVQRGGAAVALWRAGVAESKDAVRKLLNDPDAGVRLHVGRTLLADHEADAVAVLIQLLGEPHAGRARQADDRLRQLALGVAPEGRPGDPAERMRYRDTWAAWWRDATGPAVLNYLGDRIATDAEREKVRTLIQQLGSDGFQARETASRELMGLGPKAVPQLREATRDKDIEIVRRAEECLRRIRSQFGGADAAAGSVRLLAVRRPDGAADALLNYAVHADDESVEEEIYAALAVLAQRDGKAMNALATALADAAPAKRAASAVALWRAGAADQRPAVRKLLQDSDAAVRLPVALELAYAGEKEAVPVLIALLPDGSGQRAWEIHRLLTRLADDQGLAVSPGKDAVARQKCRDAWAAWWKEHEAKADVSRLANAPRQLGYTLVVLLDLNRLMEVDAEGKPRWQLDGLHFPLDAQLLPGGRVLVAENKANQVTERNLRGEILWKKDVFGPIMAQRLPNGNTFIATNDRLLEVDGDGKEVYTHVLGDDVVMRACKLPHGEIACVVRPEDQKFTCLDANLKEVRSFPARLHTKGGRIEVLPNGHVLMAEGANHRVVEYDRDGKAVWTAAIESPIVATRLPDGHTLVTSMNQNRAVELDRAGKEVWEFRADTRVTRAWRR